MFPHDASQEPAAANRAVADAPSRGVRRVVPRLPHAAPRAFVGRGVVVSGPRCVAAGPSCLSFPHRVPTRGLTVVAGPVIPS